MRGSGKALPWVLSLGIHGLVLLVLLGIIVAPSTRASPSLGVVISLVSLAASSGGFYSASAPRAAAPAAVKPSPVKNAAAARSLAPVTAELPASVAPLGVETSRDST